MSRKRRRAARPWRERPWVRPLAEGLALVLVLATFGVAAGELARRAAARERFVLDPARVVEERVPSTIPPWVRRRIETQVASLAPVGMLEPGFERRLADGLRAASPWIEDVSRVEKIYPNRARVDLRLRFPRFFFDHEGRRVLVAADGRVLDVVDDAGASRFPVALWRVEGLRLDRPPAPGERISDPEFAEALAVTAELDALPAEEAAVLRAAEPVAVVLRAKADGERAARGVVHLRTLGGTLIEWGRASRGRFGPAEIPAAQKIRHLREVLGRYEGLEGLEEVRLNFGVPYVRPVGGALEFLTPEEP